MKAAEARALLSPEALAAVDAWEVPEVPPHVVDLLMPLLYPEPRTGASDAAADAA